MRWGRTLWIACGTVAMLVASDAGAAETRELYRWLDRDGVVRYTPVLSRIPGARRSSAVKVVPGTTATGAPLTAPAAPDAIPTPNSSTTASITGAPAPGSEPFNEPSEQRSEIRDTPHSRSSWPELDARIAELEALVIADEESLKDMISAPPTEKYDELIHSQQLRDIAARLPQLHTELNELRQWRELPEDER